MDSVIIPAFAAVISATATAFFGWLVSRGKTEEALTLSARKALLQEAESIRVDLRSEIAELKSEVKLLREENLTLRKERVEIERAHREELAALNKAWQERYDELLERLDHVNS